MATRANASLVIPHSIENVWSKLRDFTFIGSTFHEIESSSILEEGRPADSVGSTRVTKWKTGETRHHRLLELSDLHYRLAFELTFSDPPSEVTATITTISCYRVSENNHTLVEWSEDFSADITADAIKFYQQSFLENLKDVRTAFN
jgi:hypothetical protein